MAARGPATTLDLIWVLLEHQKSAIVGLSLILKFGLGPMRYCDFF